MTTETASIIQVPRVQAYGLGDLNRLRPFVFEGQAGTEINHLGTSKPLSELHKYSGALRDQRFLYELGLRQKADKPVGDSESQKAGIVVYDLFQERGRGTATDDACDYNNGDPSLRKEGHASVRWVVHPASIAGGTVELGEQSEVYHILLPIAENDDSRWVLMTVDGLYRTDTGTPFALGKRKQAVQSLMKSGFSEELAENEASRFYGRSEGQGIAAVVRWSYVHGGPFYVYASGVPRGGLPFLGSFLASRSASGASQASENGVVVVTEKDYRIFVADRKRLAEIDAANKELKRTLRELGQE